MDSSQQSKKKLPKNAEKYAMNFGLVGVSKLSSKESKSRMKLPNTVAVDPCDGQIEEKLKKVLEIKTLQKSMVTLLRPSVTDRSILTPQQFRLKLGQVCEKFIGAMKKGGENFVYKELFEDILELLKNEEEKCDLLEQYRHMLLMG